MSKIELILEHIEEDCNDILQFIDGMEEKQFIQNKLIMKAVCMSLINIGELVKALPQDFCDLHITVPWRRYRA